ncbi:MAG: hypothetical protein H6555_06560 [Lewinellaceae bacterium]|nr:hypothetical protein [Lewinellaceae bacterium]
MNAQLLSEYLQDISKLYQLPYEELKTLTLQYPYAQNLHILLWIKSVMDKHPDQEKNLRRAALYCVDRNTLQHQDQLLRQQPPLAEEAFLLNEEFLELQDLSEAQARLEKIPLPDITAKEDPVIPQVNQILPAASSNILTPSESFQTEPEEDRWTQLFSPPLEAGEPIADMDPGETPGPDEILAGWAAIMASWDTGAAIEQPQQAPPSPPAVETPTVETPVSPTPATDNSAAKETPVVRPTPKTSFTSWIHQFQPPHVQDTLVDLMEGRQREENKRAQKKKKKKKKRKPADEEVMRVAERSITDNQDLASETLARLLVQQELYQRAIRVYERLILLFPEKKALFAAEIDSIKKLIT